MIKFAFLLLLAALTACTTAQKGNRTVASLGSDPRMPRYWMILGPHNQYYVRTFLNDKGECQKLSADHKDITPTIRTKEGWSSICEFQVSRSVKRLKLRDARDPDDSKHGIRLPLAPSDKHDLKNVIFIGDTGCRIDKNRYQDCTKEWIFSKVAQAAAESKPQLIVHLGDYFYREACPKDKVCTKEDIGDKEELWSEELLRSAKNLLEAAPWVVVRGNHENCARNWQGWSHYLSVMDSPSPTKCNDVESHYTVEFNNLRLLVMDTAEAPDQEFIEGVSPEKFRPNAFYTAHKDEYYRTFAVQLANQRSLSTWVVSHKPFWGIIKRENGFKNHTPDLWEFYRLYSKDPKALKDANIAAFIAGHIHTFEVLNFAASDSHEPPQPPQIIVGNSGTALDQGLPELNGMSIDNKKVYNSIYTNDTFGFLRMHQGFFTGKWTGTVHNFEGKKLSQCKLAPGAFTCASAQ